MSRRKILIISNNVLSTQKNNGKTILSFIEPFPPNNIKQLYFSEEKPEIEGYEYFQLSDQDIIKGRFNTKRRGRIISSVVQSTSDQLAVNGKLRIRKNNYTRFLRELLWLGTWKSKNLTQWIDKFDPEIIFFVAGDSIFAYRIYDYIKRRCVKAKSIIYITDDYIIPYFTDKIVLSLRKNMIKSAMIRSLHLTDIFCTVSDKMRLEYKKIFNRDSHVIMNMSDSLYNPSYQDKSKDKSFFSIVYTGSLYYGRDETIGMIADVVKKYNDLSINKFIIEVYSTVIPNAESKSKFERADCSFFKGSLAREELIEVLNNANILLFVESFKNTYVNKVEYSLSTKIPEYLSLGKPILAVGASNAGSIQYLEDAAFCINEENEVETKLYQYFHEFQNVKEDFGSKARKKYEQSHNKKALQKYFKEIVEGKNT